MILTVVKVCVTCKKEFSPGPYWDSTHCSRQCVNLDRKSKHGEARQLSDTEAAWLSGLFDGEGCVSIVSGSTTLFIINTNTELLEKVVEVTGCGRISTSRPKSFKPHWKDFGAWTVGSTAGRSLLRQMLPYLIVKRERAQIALLEWEKKLQVQA